MKNCKSIAVMSLCAGLIGSALPAHAGFLDAFNNVSNAVQQTTSTVENTKHAMNRAGSLLGKKKQTTTTTTKKVTEERVTSTMTSSGLITDKDRFAIEKAKRAWVAAFKSEDWEALVDQYADNAVVLAPDEPEHTGHAAIRTYFASDEDTSNEVFQTNELNGNDKIAYVKGTFSFTIKSRSQNTPTVNAAGKYIEIWEKQADGTWLITHDIWNTNPA